jgi:hypothetical protein
MPTTSSAIIVTPSLFAWLMPFPISFLASTGSGKP